MPVNVSAPTVFDYRKTSIPSPSPSGVAIDANVQARTNFLRSLVTTRAENAAASQAALDRGARYRAFDDLNSQQQDNYAHGTSSSLNGVVDDNAAGVARENFINSTTAQNIKAPVTLKNRLQMGMPLEGETPVVAPVTKEQSQIAANQALAGERDQRTRNLAAATQPGGKDFKDPNAPPKPTPERAQSLQDVDAARVGELNQRRDNEAASSQPGGKNYVDPNAPPKTAAGTKLTQQSYLSRSKAIIDGYPRSQQKALLARLDEEFKAAGGTPIDRGTGNGPSADPANSGAQPVDAAPGTQPTSATQSTPELPPGGTLNPDGTMTYNGTIYQRKAQ